MPKKSLSKNMEVSDRRKSYVVKDVIDYKIQAGKQWLLIYWKGYPKSESSWEPVKSLPNTFKENLEYWREAYRQRQEAIEQEQAECPKEEEKILADAEKNLRILKALQQWFENEKKLASQDQQRHVPQGQKTDEKLEKRQKKIKKAANKLKQTCLKIQEEECKDFKDQQQNQVIQKQFVASRILKRIMLGSETWYKIQFIQAQDPSITVEGIYYEDTAYAYWPNLFNIFQQKYEQMQRQAAI